MFVHFKEENTTFSSKTRHIKQSAKLRAEIYIHCAHKSHNLLLGILIPTFSTSRLLPRNLTYSFVSHGFNMKSTKNSNEVIYIR